MIIASAQFEIKGAKTLKDLVFDIEATVQLAASYQAQMLFLPEFFSLGRLASFQGSMQEMIFQLSSEAKDLEEALLRLSKTYNLILIGGTYPAPFENKIVNRCPVITPKGDIYHQHKIRPTRFERDWGMSGGSDIKIFDAGSFKFAVLICYDIEFPELSRQAVMGGASVIFVPSCTDDWFGFHRVQTCARACAITNQCYVWQNPIIGHLPEVPDVAQNVGYAGIYTPSDPLFPQGAVLQTGSQNMPYLMVQELNMQLIVHSRQRGQATPFSDYSISPTSPTLQHHVLFPASSP